eukprot:12649019-Alexandrium_andersonii.AAC.1
MCIRDSPTDDMLEVLCPGVAYTDDMKAFFERFRTRDTGVELRKLVDDQVALIYDRIRETEDLEILMASATSLMQ